MFTLATPSEALDWNWLDSPSTPELALKRRTISTMLGDP